MTLLCRLFTDRINRSQTIMYQKCSNVLRRNVLFRMPVLFCVFCQKLNSAHFNDDCFLMAYTRSPLRDDEFRDVTPAIATATTTTSLASAPLHSS